MRKFSYWRFKDGSQDVLHEGESIPTFFNGDPQFSEEEADKIYCISAETPEEAYAIHNLRRGFSPYYPMGKPIECPQCSNYFYRGSGQCFCGYSCDDQ